MFALQVRQKPQTPPQKKLGALCLELSCVSLTFARGMHVFLSSVLLRFLSVNQSVLPYYTVMSPLLWSVGIP